MSTAREMIDQLVEDEAKHATTTVTLTGTPHQITRGLKHLTKNGVKAAKDNEVAKEPDNVKNVKPGDKITPKKLDTDDDVEHFKTGARLPRRSIKAD